MHSQSKPLGEFDLIQRFFKAEADAMVQGNHNTIALGIGDDCAILKPIPGEEIAITTDMLVEGRHFFVGADPEQLAHKALAVNLSDLAAMGAKPLGFTLSIALPSVKSAWLESFSKGLFDIAKQYSCPLIGGDTTAGPLTLSITAFGSIPSGKAIRRSGANVGDDIWISGTVGDARLALAALRHEITLSTGTLFQVEHRMHRPNPRLELGIQLRNIASAAIDVSDGLLGDLKHILNQSKVDADIYLKKLPKSSALQKQNLDIQNQFAACGGDDYEICFTSSMVQRDVIHQLSNNLNLPLTLIGQITEKKNVDATIKLIDENGAPFSDAEAAPLLKSFDHFAA